MSIDQLRELFMWMSIINVALLLLSFLMTASMGGFIYRMHSRWYPMSREAFNVAIYKMIGEFKLAVIVFNVVPYIGLVIISKP